MKKAFKNLVVLMLSIITIYSCDSSDEPEQIDEISFEDITNLETDSKFNDFVEELTIISYQITNLAVAEDLISRINTLTDEEKLELANILGFTNFDSYSEKKSEIWEKWKEIVNRFGILYQDKDIIEPIFIKALLEKSNMLNPTLKTSKNNSICEELRLDCIKNVFDYLRAQTGADCTGEATTIMCFPPPMPSQGALDLTFFRIRRCNIGYYCCIEQGVPDCGLVY